MDASFQSGMTALAGGGQTGATPITRTFSRFSTVATAADSAQLPAASPGLSYTVKNAHASNSMNVFPGLGDAINAGAANAAFALASGKSAQFNCIVAGTWDVILTA